METYLTSGNGRRTDDAETSEGSRRTTPKSLSANMSELPDVSRGESEKLKRAARKAAVALILAITKDHLALRQHGRMGYGWSSRHCGHGSGSLAERVCPELSMQEERARPARVGDRKRVKARMEEMRGTHGVDLGGSGDIPAIYLGGSGDIPPTTARVAAMIQTPTQGEVAAVTIEVQGENIHGANMLSGW